MQRLKQDHRPFSARDVSFKYAIEVCERPFFYNDPVSAFELFRNRGHDIAFHSFKYRVYDLLRDHQGVLLADDELDAPGVLYHVPVVFQIEIGEQVARETGAL